MDMKRHYSIKISTQHLFVIIISVFIIGINSRLMADTSTDVSAVEQGNIRVSGTVTSATDGSTLPGLSIVLKGTTQGTVTDSEGKYTLEVPQDGVLVFSYLGFRSDEIAVDGRRVINVSMDEESETLDELVVTALGIRREEKSLGYSVSTVTGEEMTRVAQENILNSIAGKVAGVSISSTGGAGSSVSMVIRGATSLSTDNQPLFVVDGVPMTNTINNIGGFGADNKIGRAHV